MVFSGCRRFTNLSGFRFSSFKGVFGAVHGGSLELLKKFQEYLRGVLRHVKALHEITGQ